MSATARLAYAPIAGALRSLAAQVDAAELDAVLGSGRAELARLVPDLAGDDAPRVGPAAFGKERLFESTELAAAGEHAVVEKMCHRLLNSTIAAWFVVVLLTVSRMRPR